MLDTDQNMHRKHGYKYSSFPKDEKMRKSMRARIHILLSAVNQYHN